VQWLVDAQDPFDGHGNEAPGRRHRAEVLDRFNNLAYQDMYVVQKYVEICRNGLWNHLYVQNDAVEKGESSEVEACRRCPKFAPTEDEECRDVPERSEQQ
jgi:uncharacterized paraquat-inducible protein A